MPPAARGVPVLPGRYRTVRVLGKGGSALVVLVVDRAGSPRLKAVKILHPAVPPALVAGLESEFRLLAALDHPGLAHVHEFGRLADGRAYYTADFVKGRSLDAAVRPALRDVCVAMAAVCRTLSYLHARGLTHNDVKPSNIIPGAKPDFARLLDLGLAAIDSTPSGMVAGTPGYIAPERLAGRPWDGRSDLYSVGATFYRVLGGRRVVDAERPAEALARLRSGWRPLGDLRPDLPDALLGLAKDLLALDPSARPPHAAAVVARIGEAIGEAFPLETPGTARCHALSSVLVGREPELELVGSSLDRAPHGIEPRILTVAGASGLGKTRFLREIALRAEVRGFRVAVTACRESDVAGDPLSRLAGQLGIDRRADEAAAAPDLLAGLASPTLLALDDVHRASGAVWQSAFRLARRVTAERTRVTLILAFDPDSLSPASRRWLALGRARSDLHGVDLRPLAEADIDRVLVSLFGKGVIPRRMRADIAERSRGNPLLLEETVRELVETGAIRSGTTGWRTGAPSSASRARSDRLEDFLLRRCGSLPAEGRNVLLALAALGGRADAGALPDVAGAGTDVALGRALLADRGLLAVDGEQVSLVNDRLSDIAFEGVSPDRKRDLHAAAARWLDAHGADHVALAIAHRGAGNARAAFDHALAAGKRARLDGEGALAVRWLEEALASAESAGAPDEKQASLLENLGQSYDLVGRFADAEAALGRAFDLIREADPHEQVRLATLAAMMAAPIDFAAADRWLERAGRVAAGDRLAAARISLAGGVVAFNRRRVGLAREQLRAARTGLEDLAGTPEVAYLRARTLSLLAPVEARFDVGAGLALAREAVRASAEIGDRFRVVAAANNLGACENMAGRPAAAAAAYRKAIEESEQTGDVAYLPVMLANLADVEAQQGNGASARALLDQALAASAGSDGVAAMVQSSAALAAWQEDDAKSARSHARHALASALWEDATQILMIAAAAAAEQGAADEAAAFSARARSEAAAGSTPLDAAWTSAAQAYAVAARNALEGGAQLRQTADALAALGHRSDLGPLLRDAGRWLGRGGDLSSARECLARAREVFQGNGCSPGFTRIDEILDLLARGGAPAAAGSGRAVADRAGFADSPSFAVLAERVRNAAKTAGPGEAWPDVLERIASAVETLAARAEESMKSDAPTLAGTPSARMSADDSRFLELTLGQIELRHEFPGVVGRSPAIARAIALLDRLAAADIPVLLTGETGTGKEVFARALHDASRRAAGPFVAFNCAGIPASLFEAELFGHRRGSFTGGVGDHPGLVEQANGGTLFLDEVGELSPDLQPKLLRVLEERAVRPLGATRHVPVDFRLVAASNRDLADEVAAGRFRPDLYYRLNAAELRLPALRDRLADLPALCRHLLARGGHHGLAVSPRAMKRLLDHDWPGNVRELENELLAAGALANGKVIKPQHLSRRLSAPAPRSAVLGRGTLVERVAAFEREVLRAALRNPAGRVRAARALGLTRQGFRKKLHRLGLYSPPPPRPGRGGPGG